MFLNKPIPITYILNKIKFDLVIIICVALLVHFLKNRYHELLPDMPLAIPAFMGTAISVLLSFKLNQSYDRWWEARQIWGSIVNDSRTLVIEIQAFTKNENHQLIKKIAYTQIAWCYALGQSLRGLNPTENIEKYFSADELKELQSHKNVPLAVIKFQSIYIKELLKNGELEVFERVQLDSTLTRLCESQGKCERIKTTVFPTTYRKYLHFMIYLFICTLSISLDNIHAIFEIPLLISISSLFFLLEKSSSHMQDPFENRPTDTSVSAIARTVEINIRQLLKDTDIPEPVEPIKFYLL